MKKTNSACLAAALALNLLTLSGCAAQSASIGIIGGADGPTSIIVSGPGGRPLLIAGLILLFLAVVLYRIRKTKPPREEDDPTKRPPNTL